MGREDRCPVLATHIWILKISGLFLCEKPIKVDFNASSGVLVSEKLGFGGRTCQIVQNISKVFGVVGGMEYGRWLQKMS